MENMHVEALRSRVDEIIRFVKPLLPLANCHMVNFFTDHLWEAYIPSTIREEVEATDVNNVCNVFWKRAANGECPSLQRYLDEAAAHTVDGVALSHEELLLELEHHGHESPCRLHIKQFMSPKKGHEVEQMSQAVATVAAAAGVSHIVDVGSGKGYLSSMLALHHGLRVLGIDSSLTNTHGAATRVRKLQKYWPGVCRQAEEMQQGLTQPHRGKSSKKANSPPPEEEDPQQHMARLLKQVTAHVGPDTDLLGLVEQELGPSSGLALVGLHTCGDLGPTCLRLLAGHLPVRALCNVGCCYHLLSERFDTRASYWGTPLEPGDGFPVSTHLIRAGFSLGRNARMLAAQSVDRIAHNREVGSESLFYRALLQELLVAKCGDYIPRGQVGRLAAKCSSFDDYVRKAVNKLGLPIQVSCEEVAALYESFLPLRDSIKVFFLLRAYLAPVVEAVILLDRLLFLYEQGLEEAFLVELFDPVVSPRCYALVALRPTDPTSPLVPISSRQDSS